MNSSTSQTAATLTGLAAVFMWSFLSLLTVASGTMPPFQLAAITFAIGGLIGIASWSFRPQAARSLKQPLVVWALGVGGLFGYHALYFIALRLAPPAEAQLFNYLWPLLIVLFSAFLPNEKLKSHHIIGVLLGLAGTLVLIAGMRGVEIRPEYITGYLCALGAALAWSTYSVLSRPFKEVPTDAVAGFCLVTAVLSLICHLLFEQTVWPSTVLQWLSVVALGIFPVGLAFYAWDRGVKRGDIRALGAASYAAPLISTILLVVFGYAEPRGPLALATVLISLGGIVAAKDMFTRRRARETNLS
ncbi:MAG: EamA family transporter [Xanthobacteraceae bacterium]|jgi:drug/metabolite transporter (DMT)-like permease|nr:EamA family transporter [Xanthobacteraceae bacterium]